MGFNKMKLEDKLPPPVSTQSITASDLRGLLNFLNPTDGLFLSDAKDYFLCNQKDVDRFVAADKTDAIKYVQERMDCDDFAYRLMGQFSAPPWSALAMGIMWTDVHALNCFVAEDRKLYYLEPQSDAVKGQLDSWQGSSIRFVLM
jgi:hypothetical protein